MEIGNGRMINKLIKDMLLITDMDGTLLDSNGNISKENLNAIEKFRKAGGKFCVATGRSVLSMASYFETLKFDIPIILYNGSVIYDYNKKEYLHNVFLPETIYDGIEDVMKDFPDVGVLFVSDECYYIPQSNQSVDDFFAYYKIKSIKCTLADVPKQNSKGIFTVPLGMMDEFSKYITQKYGSQVHVTRSSVSLCEIIPLNTSKGAALLKLCEILNVDVKNTVAIGDYDNDIELIKNAGIGISVKNATDNLKSVTDIILDYTNDENVLEKVVEYIMK